MVVSELPLLTWRRCEARCVLRRRVEGASTGGGAIADELLADDIEDQRDGS